MVFEWYKCILIEIKNSKKYVYELNSDRRER